MYKIKKFFIAILLSTLYLGNITAITSLLVELKSGKKTIYKKENVTTKKLLVKMYTMLTWDNWKVHTKTENDHFDFGFSGSPTLKGKLQKSQSDQDYKITYKDFIVKGELYNI